MKHNTDLIILVVVLVGIAIGGVYAMSLIPSQQQIYNILTK